MLQSASRSLAGVWVCVLPRRGLSKAVVTRSSPVDGAHRRLEGRWRAGLVSVTLGAT